LAKVKNFAKTGYGQICADIKGTLIENPRVGGSIPPLAPFFSPAWFKTVPEVALQGNAWGTAYGRRSAFSRATDPAPNLLAHSYSIVTVPGETPAYRLNTKLAIFVAFPVL
jgi:hypothetical protein